MVRGRRLRLDPVNDRRRKFRVELQNVPTVSETRYIRCDRRPPFLDHFPPLHASSLIPIPPSINVCCVQNLATLSSVSLSPSPIYRENS